MSGGSLDYVYSKLDNAIYEMKKRATTNLEYAFIQHLQDTAKALHDLEWYYSGDYSEEQAMESIRKVISKEDELKIMVERAQNIRNELKELLEMIEN